MECMVGVGNMWHVSSKHTRTQNEKKITSTAATLFNFSLFAFHTHTHTHSFPFVLLCKFVSNRTQVESYVQFIWQQIEPNENNLYNGAATASLTLLGAISAFVVGTLSSKYFDRWDLWIITGCSGIQCGLVLWLTLTDSLIVAYVTYVLFGTLYHFLITVAR